MTCLSLALTLSDCSIFESAVKPKPTAQFTYNIGAGAVVNFTNQSSNANSYTWDYGDGTPFDIVSSPTHTFLNNGTFEVILTANGDGGSATTTRSITITNANVGTFTFNGVVFNGTTTAIYDPWVSYDVDVLITDTYGNTAIVYNIPGQSSGTFNINDGYSADETSALYVLVSVGSNVYASVNGGTLTKTGSNTFILSGLEYDILNSGVKYSFSAGGSYPNP